MLNMKFAVFLCIALQLYVANGKTVPNLPRPCHKSDPDYEGCVTDTFQKLVRIMAKGIPQYYIPAMDPYLVPELTKNIVYEDYFNGTATFKNMKFSNLMNAKVSNIKVNFDDYSADVELFHPDVIISLQYSVDGVFLGSPMHAKGLFTGKLSNTLSTIKIKLNIVEKKGVQYFVLEDLKLNWNIQNASIKVVASDPEQQIQADFFQSVFNQNPRQYLDNLSSLYVNEAVDYMKFVASGVLSVFPANYLFPQ